MMSRKMRIQLAIFLVIAVLGTGYVGGRYAGLDWLIGAGGYPVTVDMNTAGGIFPNAEVTYRGVAVGRVTGMKLTHDGIAVQLTINDSAPPIPASTRAVVANRSAVGEQYVDLQPARRDGPYLTSGSVIPVAQTAIPPAPESLLVNADRLVSSVPTDSLRTVVTEVGTAFDGAGPDLQRLLDTTGKFTTSADAHLPQTQSLLDNSDVVLRTQQQQAQQLTEFSTGLRQISGQLKQSDPDLRTIINTAPGAATEVQQLTNGLHQDFGVVVANLLTTSRLTSVRIPGMQQTLVTLPVISAFTHSLAADNTGHLGVVFDFFDPANCTKGYESTPRKEGNDTSEGPTNTNAHCAEPHGSPTGVRGSQNAVRYPVPDAVPPPG